MKKTQVCTSCREEKSVLEFSKANTLTGLRYDCKQCVRDKNKVLYYKKRKQKERELKEGRIPEVGRAFIAGRIGYGVVQ